jgi:hypothetical protein
MQQLTGLQASQAALAEIATRANAAALALQAVDEVSVVDGILSGASANFDAQIMACTRLGETGWRALVDSKIAEVEALVAAGTLPHDMTPQHKVNLRAAADALDLAKQALLNFGQAARDAKADL